MKGLLRKLLEYLWKGTLIGGLSIIALVLAGFFLRTFGLTFPEIKTDYHFLNGMIFLSGFIYTLTGGIIIKNLHLPKIKIIVSLLLLFFLNTVTQMLEAVYFAPGIISWEVVPAILGQQLIMFSFISVGLACLFKPAGSDATMIVPQFKWVDRLGRVFVGAGSYLCFYYIFGSLNAFFFTGDYYQTQIYGLKIPENWVILLLETVRGFILVLSVLPWVFHLQAGLKKRMVIVGASLYSIGGLVPMLLQLNALPLKLVIASSAEMFFQFFLTGAAVTYILFRGFHKNREGKEILQL